MGGNVSILKNNKTYKAEKIPIKEIGRKNFINDFNKLFITLNEIFYNKYGYKLWDNNLIKQAIYFNGSTSYLMNTEIPDNPLLDLKPKAGDIDIITREDAKEDLWNLLKELEDTYITKNIKYIGNNKPSLSSISDQINALFEYFYEKDKSIHIQVDLEFEEVEKDTLKPLQWAKFAHSSSIKDLEIGVKAVFHKYLARAIAYAVSIKQGYFVTAKADCSNWEKKLKKKRGSLIDEEHIIKFSLKGIRYAYEPLICNDEIVRKDGKIVFREIPSKTAKRETNFKVIFEMLFNKEPTLEEINLLWSFKGLVQLMKKYFNKKTIEIVFNRFLELLWDIKGNRNIAQELERNNPELDFEIKISAVKYLIKQFPFLKTLYDKYQKNIDKYYQNYGNRGLIEQILFILKE